MKKKIVATLCLLTVLLTTVAISIIPTSAATTDWIDREPLEDVDYSFAVLGDLQFSTYHDTKSSLNTLEKLFSWILDNKESRNIQYVFGLGDSVQSMTTYEAFRNPPEWDLISAQYARLNGNIPYGVVRGNHDDEVGYHEHVCTEYYKSQMEGFFFDPTKSVTLGNSMSNSYQTIEIGNHKYLMLNLDFRVTPESLAWANDVIYEHYEYKVIISTHAYLNHLGEFDKEDIGSSNVDNTVLEWVAFDGEYLWENLFSRHENVMMVLCGHLGGGGPVVRTRKAEAYGNEVIEILVAPDAYEKDNPCGLVLMLNFTENAQKIEIEYYSPSKGKYLKENNYPWALTLPEGMLPVFDPTPVSVETEAVTKPADTTDAKETNTEAATEDATEKEKNPQGLTVTIVAVLGGLVVLCLVFLIVSKAKKK